MMKNKLIAVLVVALSFLGCTQSKNEPTLAKQNNVVVTEWPVDQENEKLAFAELQNKVIQNVSKNVIMNTYKGLAASAKALHEQIFVLETSRTQQNLDKAQDLWKQARQYWESTESFLFGPVESLAIDPMIDTWPLNRADLKAILNGGSAITADFIRGSGTNIKGFHTIEFLLFGDGIETNRKSISNLTAREVEYLKATTEILAEDTARLSYGWTTRSNPDDVQSPAYIDLISQPGTPNNPYFSAESVIIEFINGMIGIADEVGNGKIADPLGGSITEVDLDAEESPYSWNSIADFSDNIRSLQMMYIGVNGTNLGSDVGIKALLDRKDRQLSNEVAAQIKLAIEKIQAIAGSEGTSFGKVISDPEKRHRAIEAKDEVNKLFAMLEQRVLPLFQ